MFFTPLRGYTNRQGSGWWRPKSIAVSGALSSARRGNWIFDTEAALLVALSEAPYFFTIAAHLHVAPTPRVVFGGVDEQPGARLRCADAHRIEIGRRHQVDCRFHDRGERRLQVVRSSVSFEREAPVEGRESRGGVGPGHLIVQRRKIRGSRCAAGRQRRERPVKRLAYG